MFGISFAVEYVLTRFARFACAAYRRSTNFIRIPTTVIGLIDASVSIKVAVNYGNYKNRLGAYHAPMHTFLDFDFLKTLPESQVRNGFAELIKISSCADIRTFDLLDEFCERLIQTHFGRINDVTGEVKRTADEINRAGIFEMLKLETPNLHEIGLDRVIAYGHTWSPLHEVCCPPLSVNRFVNDETSFHQKFHCGTATQSPLTWLIQQPSQTCGVYFQMTSIDDSSTCSPAQAYPWTTSSSTKKC